MLNENLIVFLFHTDVHNIIVLFTRYLRYLLILQSERCQNI